VPGFDFQPRRRPVGPRATGGFFSFVLIEGASHQRGRRRSAGWAGGPLGTGKIGETPAGGDERDYRVPAGGRARAPPNGDRRPARAGAGPWTEFGSTESWTTTEDHGCDGHPSVDRRNRFIRSTLKMGPGRKKQTKKKRGGMAASGGRDGIWLPGGGAGGGCRGVRADDRERARERMVGAHDWMCAFLGVRELSRFGAGRLGAGPRDPDLRYVVPAGSVTAFSWGPNRRRDKKTDHR